MDVTIIFETASILKSIAAYLGIIDNLSADVKRLLHQSLKSAIQNLEFAKNSSSDNQLDYLRTARSKFIDAISVEENENLVSSYLGLAMCQFLLGDKDNAHITLSKISTVQLTTTERSKAIALDISGMGGVLDHNPSVPLPQYMIWRGVKRFFGTKGTNESIRETTLEEYKQSALMCTKVF